MLLELLEQVGLEVGARADVHDLEDRRQRVVVVDRRVALDQLAEAVEQMLEAQHRADALVERVLVDDQGGRASRGRPTAAGDQTGGRADCFTAIRAALAGDGQGPRRDARPARARCTSRASSSSAMPSLVDHRIGDRRGAARRERLLRDHRARRVGAPAGRAATRAICTASSQSTTQTAVDPAAPAARFDQQRHVEDERRRAGSMPRRLGARPRRPISGCRIASRRRRDRGVGERGARACAARSSAAVGGDELGAERGARWPPIAAPPGSGQLARDQVGVDHDRADAARASHRPCSCRCRCRR